MACPTLPGLLQVPFFAAAENLVQANAKLRPLFERLTVGVPLVVRGKVNRNECERGGLCAG